MARVLVSAAVAVWVSGCGGGDEAGTGSVTILLESEDVIVEGLEPGDDVENVQDGWAVDFEKYIVTIGDIDLHLSTDESVVAEAGDVFVIDLTEIPAAGAPLWSLDGLQAGRWELNYVTPGAADGSTRHGSVAQTDYDDMVAEDWTYLVDGLLTKADGQSCPPASLATPGDAMPNGNASGGNPCYDAGEIRFTFGATAETQFGPCTIDGVPGFVVSEGGTQSATLTIHGDHLFFNGFPEGDEGGVMRLAQWLADCDLDLDGTVTREELESIAPADLPELDERFQLGGSPLTPLETMYDYVVAQFKTQGHFQGEGECPIDGVDHDHE